MSLLNLLTDHPAESHAPLVHTVDQAVSKGDVLNQVDRLSAEITAITANTHVPVAVVAEGLPALVAMFACWQADAVFVPVNPRQPASAIDEVVLGTACAARVHEGSVHAETDSQAAQHATDVGFVLWTSGTTGKPKAVLHTHTAYLELIDRVLGPLRDRPANPNKPPTPNLIPVSMALNAGIYNVLFGLRAGAEIVLMERFTTATFAALVQRHGIRSTVLPPAALAMLADDNAVTDLAPLRYVRSITAPLSPFQAKRFASKFSVTVLNGYGQAEIGEVIGWTAGDAKEHPEKIGAVGRAHPGVEIRIDQPDDNAVGELLVKPPNRTVGYADDTDFSERLTADGFVHTGDLARLDPEGFVWIEGRQSDLINRGGNKVFPDEVEEVLASVSGVAEVAVVARPDDRLGEVPVAVVVGDASEHDLELAARSNLPAYKVPVAFLRVAELPRSDVGKVLRKQLATEVSP